MEAAIRELTRRTGKKRGILVAGDMLELGDSSKYYHEQIGRIAAEAKISRLYLTGECRASSTGGDVGRNGRERYFCRYENRYCKKSYRLAGTGRLFAGKRFALHRDGGNCKADGCGCARVQTRFNINPKL
jgi:hypothetical protein